MQVIILRRFQLELHRDVAFDARRIDVSLRRQRPLQNQRQPIAGVRRLLACIGLHFQVLPFRLPHPIGCITVEAAGQDAAEGLPFGMSLLKEFGSDHSFSIYQEGAGMRNPKIGIVLGDFGVEDAETPDDFRIGVGE